MAGKFQGVDFFDIDSLLSEEERMVRDMVREWVDDNVMPVIQEAYINRIAAAGITLGCNPPSNTQYCPTGSLIRSAGAVMIHRAVCGGC